MQIESCQRLAICSAGKGVEWSVGETGRWLGGEYDQRIYPQISDCLQFAVYLADHSKDFVMKTKRWCSLMFTNNRCFIKDPSQNNIEKNILKVLRHLNITAAVDVFIRPYQLLMGTQFEL